MCSEYELYTELAKVDDSLGFKINKPKIKISHFELHVRIYGQAPIIVINDGKPSYEFAQFSLKPPGTPFSTFNARLADWDAKQDKVKPIYEKATWKKPFVATRCLIPMSAFYEPIYLGDHAGQVMAFKSPKAPILFAAGIYSEGQNPKKPGELYIGFSIIIHTAIPFVLETGHHRTPMLLAGAAARSYLEDSMTAQERYKFLLNNRDVPELTATSQRLLAKGWEKRVGENQKAHDEELEFKTRFSSR